MRSSNIYTVKYSTYDEDWAVYINGQRMVKSENPGAVTGRYNYHVYDTKKEAVKKARRFAKNDSERSQLQIQNKAGQVIDVNDYEGSDEVGRRI